MHAVSKAEPPSIFDWHHEKSLTLDFQHVIKKHSPAEEETCLTLFGLSLTGCRVLGNYAQLHISQQFSIHIYAKGSYNVYRERDLMGHMMHYHGPPF